MRHTDVTLGGVLEDLANNGIKDRSRDLNDLQHVIRQNQRNQKVEALGDVPLHQLFEILFGIAISDQSLYLKAKTGPTKASAAKRLSDCAATIRLTVKVSVRSLRSKTIKALVDHLTAICKTSTGGLCEPLALDYVKALRSLLSYQPHVEHLQRVVWEEVVSFGIEQLRNASTPVDNNVGSGLIHEQNNGPRQNVSFKSSRLHGSHRGDSQGTRALSKQVAEEVADCLRLLTRAPNAPVTKRSADILWALIDFLKTNVPTPRSTRDSFSAINHVLNWTITEDISLSKNTTVHLVRLARTYWQTRSIELKDEIMICLTNLRPIVSCLMCQEDAMLLREELSSLFGVLRTEYNARLKENQQLQLDDLRLELYHADAVQRGLLHTAIFSLRDLNPKAEQHWVLVSILAFLCGEIMAQDHDDRFSDEDEDGIASQPRPRKRARRSGLIEDLVECALCGAGSDRVPALQTIAFASQHVAFTELQMTTSLGHLSQCCIDDNSSVSSWAFISIAGLATQGKAVAFSLVKTWSSIWQIGVRSITSASTCRAASHLLNVMLRLRLVPRTISAGLTQYFTSSIDSNGPALLCDSSLQLLCSIMERTATNHPASANIMAEHILGWLSRTWSPSRYDDRTYALILASIGVVDVVNLVACCLAQPCPKIVSQGLPVWYSVAANVVRAESRTELLSYLLLLPQDKASVTHCPLRRDSLAGSVPDDIRTVRPTAQGLVLHHMNSELVRLLEDWKSVVQDRPRSVSLEAFSALSSSCIIILCISHQLDFVDERRMVQIREHCATTLKAIESYMTSANCGQDKIDSFLAVSALTFPALYPNIHQGHSGFLVPNEILAGTIVRSMTTRQDMNELDEFADFDTMDREEQTDSQDSQGGSQMINTSGVANAYAASFSIHSLRASVYMFASITVVNGDKERNESWASTDQSHVIDITSSLPMNVVLAARGVLSSLPNIGYDLTIIETEQLLVLFSEQVLRSYQYNRSEVALGTILDIMSSTKSIWTDSSSDSLYGLGLDIYEWFTTDALGAGVLSPNVQEKVSNLLLELCHIDTGYGAEVASSSVRTSLFKLLRNASITIQFHLAGRISAIFGLFVLSTHNEMFDDLQQSLPIDMNWTEGIAMRLRILAGLASSWRSLLRQCIYYIFETAGNVKCSKEYATTCMDKVAASLGFDTPRKIFALLSPQLLHTWLDSHPLEKLPFEIFGYGSLADLLVQNEKELVAQLFLRESQAGLNALAHLLEQTAVDLVKLSFGKTFAYAMSWDISNPPPDASSVTCEIRLRHLIGSKEKFKQLIRDDYPVILGQLFLSIHRDDQDDAWLERRDAYTAAAKALTEMRRYSCSTNKLSENQQPRFRSKYLPDQLERLGRRLGLDPPGRLWVASSYTLAARMLFDTIDDALGSLHNCEVLRRLRLLIVLSDDVPLSGYQLEMTLRALIPFLADSQCADDSLGMIHYLYLKGAIYLASNLPFLCGTAILALLYMSKHIHTQHESTTQESQHRETVQRMLKFRTWLVGYLQRFQEDFPIPIRQDVKSLFVALANFELPANARTGTAESVLMLFLLRQSVAQDPFVQKQDVLKSLAILTEHFAAPSSLADDCLEEDDLAIEYAPILWRLTQGSVMNEQFLLWASMVVGRAYVATGSNAIVEATKDGSTPSQPSTDEQGLSKSQRRIAEQATLLLSTNKRQDASIGEYTLRACFSTFLDSSEAAKFERMLPETSALTFADGTYSYVPFGVGEQSVTTTSTLPLRIALRVDNAKALPDWIAELAVLICQLPSTQPLLKALPIILRNVKATAVSLLPSIVHIVLADEIDKEPTLKLELGASMTQHFVSEQPELKERQRYLIQLFLYLRSQVYPREATKMDRLQWLPCEYLLAAKCAARCDMPSTALMFAELARTTVTSNRRSSSRAYVSHQPAVDIPDSLLLTIFQAIDEPDSYYGVQQQASIDSVLRRLEYEGSGFKTLMFRSAQVDGKLSDTRQLETADTSGMIGSLSGMNMHSLTFALASGSSTDTATTSDALLDSARMLQQWDIPVPDSNKSDAASLFKALQSLCHATDLNSYNVVLQRQVVDHVRHLLGTNDPNRPTHQWLSVLGTLTENLEVTSSTDMANTSLRWDAISGRQKWMELSPFADFQIIMHNRPTLMTTIAGNNTVLQGLHSSVKDAKTIEAKALLTICALARKHGQHAAALSLGAQIGNVAAAASSVGLHIDSAARREIASVLWDSGERAASVNMLREVVRSLGARDDDIKVGRSGLLSQLGQQLAEARLEKPADILQNYLKPAITELQTHDGQEAGQVFYAFASFCDQQLQNPAALEDFNRISKLRQVKLEEVQQLQALVKASKRSSSEKTPHEYSLKKAQQWLNLDNEEFERHKQARDTFMQQSLQNYMLALQASDEHDICVLRFFALWLENSDSRRANDTVGGYLSGVPSWKFVLLMNQLMSRIKHEDSAFQRTLMDLVYRICREHQYHSVHHIYASRKSWSKDEAAKLRAAAAAHLCKRLETDKEKGEDFKRMLRADSLYRMLAEEPNGDRRSGKYPLKDSPYASKVSRHLPQDRVPPATLDLPLEPDGQYLNVPVVTAFANSIQVMTGLSAPKVLTAVASNGQRYKQLFKGGNDDLRQDAIMEQTFGEVSKMLRHHLATRQRNLHVRTYKVIPLTNKSGIIEFVPNSIPINEFLQPAHQKYHPGSIKPSTAREKIHAVAGHSTDSRVKEYRKVCEQMPPVMRHFFFERFDDPDEWFAKRTAYTRTTATVSMLGQVLGLGDRHCHNILLDEKSGEVVHIDLGVAFEAGRVLPIPELVPFRLTRDIVDGMGVTGTEGIFQRCCEFTIDALREDKDSIMTLLNVLRYDPLYSWTLSPLRAKRMQEQEGETKGDGANGADEGSSRKKDHEAGEADRALSVVEKKLSKTLSTAATVSELIQQARDERNLATLFNGWAAFF